MRLSSKHENESLIQLSKFDGGLQYNVNIEGLEINELYQADNFEFNPETASLSTVSGATKYTDTGLDINNIWFNYIHNEILIGSEGKLYKVKIADVRPVTLIGSLTGTMPPVFTTFRGNVYIASGGKLQSYDGASLTTITKSPESSIVFVKSGRVIVAKQGSDRLTFSAVGDPTSWEDDPENDSSAKWIDIGYGDDTDITSITTINQDIVIFKNASNTPFGMVFRLINDYPYWEVKEVSRNIHCSNQFSSLQAGNDVFYLGHDGFNSLSTVMEYGSVKQVEAGKKVNVSISATIKNDKARMWHIPSKQQIWVQTNSLDRYVWLYHYNLGAFTKRRFYTGELRGVAVSSDDVYLAIGSKILVLDSAVFKEDTVDIRSTMTTKRFVSINDYLVKRIYLDLYNMRSGTGTIQVGKASLPISVLKVGAEIFGDLEEIYGDTVDIWEAPSTSIIARINYRTKAFEVTIQLANGGVAIRNIGILCAEV